MTSEFDKASQGISRGMSTAEVQLSSILQILQIFPHYCIQFKLF